MVRTKDGRTTLQMVILRMGATLFRPIAFYFDIYVTESASKIAIIVDIKKLFCYLKKYLKKS